MKQLILVYVYLKFNLKALFKTKISTVQLLPTSEYLGLLQYLNPTYNQCLALVGKVAGHRNALFGHEKECRVGKTK